MFAEESNGAWSTKYNVPLKEHHNLRIHRSISSNNILLSIFCLAYSRRELVLKAVRYALTSESDTEIEVNSMRKIVIWGTGNTSENFTKKILPNAEIVAYIDNFSLEASKDKKIIYKWDEFIKNKIEYEYVIVASIYSNEISQQCQTNLNMEKVIFLYPFGYARNFDQITYSEKSIDFLKKIAPDYIDEWLDRRILKEKWELPNNIAYVNWKKNIQFKNLHYGKRCFILGNGPSLGEVDLQKLENEIVFTTNFFNRIVGYEKVHTNYHFWIDSAFFMQRKDQVIEKEELMECYQKIGREAPVCFVPFKAEDYLKRNCLNNILDFHYLRTGEFPKEISKKALDICGLIPPWRNVVQYAIVVAIYMGFKDIYLLGCDASCLMPILEFALGEEISQSHAYATSTADSTRYKTTLESWSMSELFYDQYIVFWGYEKLHEFCIEQGINLVNCTSHTLINKIPRMDLVDVLQ